MTVALSDRFAERLNYYPIVYQSFSERSERSFVFQRVSAVFQSLSKQSHQCFHIVFISADGDTVDSCADEEVLEQTLLALPCAGVVVAYLLQRGIYPKALACLGILHFQQSHIGHLCISAVVNLHHIQVVLVCGYRDGQHPNP